MEQLLIPAVTSQKVTAYYGKEQTLIGEAFIISQNVLRFIIIIIIIIIYCN
jgi:hypothetical protein